MNRWSLLLCLTCLGGTGCFVSALPVLPGYPRGAGTALGREVQLLDPAEQLLEKVAAHLARGQERAAAALLEQYLDHEPRHLFIRAQTAELLFRQGQWAASRRHFEWCIGLSQEFGSAAYQYLIHAHSRLVDIAAAEQNAYAENLHRGMGLYELASHRLLQGEASPPMEVTAILGRAAMSLQDARSEDPSSARPHWYLYLVWTKLGQHEAAGHSLAQAEHRKFFAELTPHERREIQTASWWMGNTSGKKNR